MTGSSEEKCTSSLLIFIGIYVEIKSPIIYELMSEYEIRLNWNVFCGLNWKTHVEIKESRSWIHKEMEEVFKFILHMTRKNFWKAEEDKDGFSLGQMFKYLTF